MFSNAPKLALAAAFAMTALAPIGIASANEDFPKLVVATKKDTAKSYSAKAKKSCLLCFNGWTKRNYWYCGPGKSCPLT